MGIQLETSSPMEWVRGSLIGAGAFGTVSLAINKSNGELFAVKSMRAELNSVVESEYNILRSLDSPYVVRCLGKDCTVENGMEVCNLWMEYVPGGSVGDLVANFGGRLDESVIRAYTRCILRGIEYLHGQGILHCDIKGKNVLVGTGGVKLADFGSAKRVKDEGSGNRDPFQLRGTPLWMAPEVVNQVEQGPASDIWSLGCTVVEMATGRPPWSDVSNPLAAMYRIGCTNELPELPRRISPQGRDFLEKCFRRDPQQRWTAAQLLNHPFLDGDGFSATEVKRAPLSPTSTLDSGHPDLKSCSSSLFVTVPILALDTARPARKPEAKDEKKSIQQYCSPMSSPRDRVLALAVGGEMPNWCASPPSGQWIIVRSSSTTMPTSNRYSSTKADYDSGSAASVDYKSQSILVNSGLETSEEQSQRECKLPSGPTTTPLIADLVQHLYEISSEHIRGHHRYPGPHNRLAVGKILYDSTTRACRFFCLKCVLRAKQSCPKCFRCGQLYINFIAGNHSCNLTLQLIQILSIWLIIWFVLVDDSNCSIVFL